MLIQQQNARTCAPQMIRGPGAEDARTHHHHVVCYRHVGIITEVTTFKALLATNDNGKFAAAIQQIPLGVLPPGEVLVRVKYSSLNYKDGLAVTGKPGVIRTFPMVPGVDFAGVVEESTSANFNPGDEVVVTGCGTSEVFWGGYAELARLDQDFIVPVPKGMTLKQAMGVGTAGFTAMQSVMEMERHGLKPGGREVVVTGAAGGVGSVAIAILAKLGYKAVAIERPRGAARLSAEPGCQLDHRAQRARDAFQKTSGGGTLGRRDRQRRRRYAGRVAANHGAGRERRVLRRSRWPERRDHRVPVHSARREPAGHRFLPRPECKAARDLGAHHAAICRWICSTR